MRKVDTCVLVVAFALAATGFGSGFALALLHAAQGNWGYMVVFLVVMAGGSYAVYVMWRNMRTVLDGLEEIETKETT